MTVKEFRKKLSFYPADAHVVIAIMPDLQVLVGRDGKKFDAREVWQDGTGAVNIIATTPADVVAPSLRVENGL